jgi:diguanylate cyclase (GGDEF)-like protein
MLDKLKSLVVSYVSSGTRSSDDLEIKQQIYITNIFGFIGYSLTGILGGNALFDGNLTLGIILLVTAGLFLSSYFILHHSMFTTPYKASANLVTCSLMLLMFYLIYSGGLSNTGPLWVFVVAPVALFFGGMRNGTQNIGMFVFIMSIMLFYPDNLLLGTTYTMEFKTRILYSFLSVSCLFAFYEFMRQRAFNRFKKINKKFEQQAMHDHLTGLQNRRGMLTTLEHELDRIRRYSSPLTVMMCDIDNFKRVNDKYGHETGDRVIQTLATLFKSAIRKQDTVARWGGEEYLFLLPQIDVVQALVLAEKLRHKVCTIEFDSQGKSFNVNVSIGIYQFKETDTINQGVSKADDYMYQAKKLGRNRCMH